MVEAADPVTRFKVADDADGTLNTTLAPAPSENEFQFKMALFEFCCTVRLSGAVERIFADPAATAPFCGKVCAFVSTESAQLTKSAANNGALPRPAMRKLTFRLPKASRSLTTLQVLRMTSWHGLQVTTSDSTSPWPHGRCDQEPKSKGRPLSSCVFKSR